MRASAHQVSEITRLNKSPVKDVVCDQDLRESCRNRKSLAPLKRRLMRLIDSLSWIDWLILGEGCTRELALRGASPVERARYMVEFGLGQPDVTEDL